MHNVYMFIKPEKWVIIYRLLYTLVLSVYIGHLFLLAYVTLYNDCQFFTVWTFYNLCCQSFTETAFNITWNTGTHIFECLYWDICRLNKIWVKECVYFKFWYNHEPAFRKNHRDLHVHKQYRQCLSCHTGAVAPSIINLHNLRQSNSWRREPAAINLYFSNQASTEYPFLCLLAACFSLTDWSKLYVILRKLVFYHGMEVLSTHSPSLLNVLDSIF